MSAYPTIDDRAPCKKTPDLFYGESAEDSKAAKKVCQEGPCPFIAECLQWALHHEQWGVWGATSANERKRIRKQRGIVLDPLTVDRTAEMDATVRWMSQRGQSATDIAQALGMSVAFVANARKRSAS